MKKLVLLVVILLPPLSSEAAEYQLTPGDVPQEALDRAAPGDRLVFLPGLHQHHLGKYRSLLYIDKSVEIELQAGATLKLADGETSLEATPEITTDHGAPKKLDDLIVGGDSLLANVSQRTDRGQHPHSRQHRNAGRGRQRARRMEATGQPGPEEQPQSSE